MNPQFRKRWFIAFLGGYFLASCFTYVFPLMILLLTDRGFSGSSAATVQVVALLAAAWAVPRFGIALDRGRHSRVFSLLAVFIGLGLVPFAFQNIPQAIVVLAAICFVVGAATVNICVTRFTEGLADIGELPKSASLTYLASNSALGISSLLAYLFIDRFPKTLVTLDVLSTLTFIVFLAYGYRFVGEVRKQETSSREPPIWNFICQHPAAALAVAAIFTTLYCHISAVPLLYLHMGVPAKRFQTLMMLTNTVGVVIGSLLYARGWFGKQKKILFVSATLLAALPHMLVPYWVTPFGAVTIAAVAAIGEALAYPLVTEWILGFFDKSKAGQAVGIRDMLIKIALISAPLLGAIIYELPSSIFVVVFGGLPLLAAVSYLCSNSRVRFA